MFHLLYCKILTDLCGSSHMLGDKMQSKILMCQSSFVDKRRFDANATPSRIASKKLVISSFKVSTTELRGWSEGTTTMSFSFDFSRKDRRGSNNSHRPSSLNRIVIGFRDPFDEPPANPFLCRTMHSSHSSDHSLFHRSPPRKTPWPLQWLSISIFKLIFANVFKA